MKDYTYTRTLGVFVGVLTIIGALGFGLLSFIGISLSKAFNTGFDYSLGELAMIILFLLLIGFFTALGSTGLKKKQKKNTFYSGYCFLLGLGFVIAFFISFGAIGVKNELFLLCIGVIYIVLGYFSIKGK